MAPPTPQLPGASRAVWLKNLHRWHWISSAMCLTAMLMFSITGITLNHAAGIEAKPVVTKRQGTLPAALLPLLRQAAAAHADARAPLPAALADWVRASMQVDVAGREAEWNPDEAYIALPRPGGDAWLRLATSGEAEYEKTDRGWISWLNDLHKGRNTGSAWSWFIDLFGVAALVFSITGFLILKYHAANRPSTWPVVGFGIVLPLLLALLFIH
jgi:hypothetical protein